MRAERYYVQQENNGCATVFCSLLYVLHVVMQLLSVVFKSILFSVWIARVQCDGKKKKKKTNAMQGRKKVIK